MPIYEYRCNVCGHADEHLQKVSDAPLSVCPACGKPEYRKQLSAAGFHLKGTGWYATDFKGGGKKADSKKSEAKADTKTEADGKATDTKTTDTKTTDTKTDTKNDSKPDNKPETKAAA